jgi:hypothetical protein
MSNTRCEQDLVGFNPQNSAQVLTIGVPTIVNDALVIDTRAIIPYSGSVQLRITDELGMTATFVESGTADLTKVVVAGQLLRMIAVMTDVVIGSLQFIMKLLLIMEIKEAKNLNLVVSLIGK